MTSRWLGRARPLLTPPKRPRAFLAIEGLEDRVTPSHMRYLNLTWERDTSDSSNLTDDFHFQTAWRTGFYPSDNTIGNRFNFGNLNYGDGATGTLMVQVLSVANGVTYGEAVRLVSPGVYTEGLVHTYSTTNNYLAYFQSSARIGGLKNTNNGTYRVETIVNAGTTNDPPVTSMAPIVQVADNQINTFAIPAVDPDGDTLHFRLATAAEVQGGGTYNQPTGISVNPNTGVVTWDIRNGVVNTAPGDLWTSQMVVEDLDAQGNVKSKTPIDFLLSVIDGTTNAAPVFDHPPTPTSNVNVVINTPISFTVQASDPNATDSVSFVALNAPQAMTVTTVSPIAGARANAVAQRYDWTPSAPGTFVITYQATDSRGRTSITSITIRIFVGGLPGVKVTESGGSTDVAEGGNNDSFTVALQSQPQANVTVTLNPNPQLLVAPTSLVFTPQNWSTPQSVTVSAVDDAIAQGNRTVPINFGLTSSDTDYNGFPVSALNVNITDNDIPGVTVIQSGNSTDVTEGGNTDTYTVLLNTQPSATVTINLSPDSNVSVGPTQLVFTTSNWNVAQTVTVTAVDDHIFEGPHLGIITHTFASQDAIYAGLSSFTVTAHVTDNDLPGATIVESGGSTYVVEGLITDTYTVVLTSQPLGNVTLTASHDNQITLAPLVLVFTPANWNVPQTVTVAGVVDNIIEGLVDSDVTYTATSSDPSYDGIGVAGIDVTVNDPPGVKITTGPGLLGVLEGNTLYPQKYTVQLLSEPADTVTISVNPDPQLYVSAPTLVFTQDNWNVPQSVSAFAVDNSLADGNRVVSISHTATSNDPGYNGLSISDVNLEIIDDENTLIVRGTENADTISVLFSNTTIQTAVNGRATFYPAAYDQVVVLAGGGNDKILLAAPTIPVAVLGGLGSDKVQIDGRPSGNTFVLDGASVLVNGQDVVMTDVESAVFNGKAGNDTLTVDSMPIFPVQFQGAGGQDRINAPDQTNNWSITANDTGTLNGLLSFNSTEYLMGGNGDDTFASSNGRLSSGQVNGGAGNNTLDMSAWKSAVTVNLQTHAASSAKNFQNINTVIGGFASDKVIGANASNVWDVTDVNTIALSGIDFLGFENLTGGTLDDTFIIENGEKVTGKIDGGGGIDTLDDSAYLTPVTVNLQLKTATGTGGFLNIESFLGSSAGSADTIIAANTVNTWTLTGTGAGTLNLIAFANFENLTGGLSADTFNLSGGTWTGTLDGGKSTDKINSNGGIYVSMGTGTGTLNGMSFKNVEIWN